MSERRFRKIIIEVPNDERYGAEVLFGTTIRELGMDFFESQDWPAQARRGRGQRAVVELVNPADPTATKRLRNDLTIEDAGVEDGDTLRIFPKITTGCFVAGTMVSLTSSKASKDCYLIHNS